MQPIKGLVFDKDGTLFNFRATWDVWGARLIDELSGSEAERAQLSEVLGYDTATSSFRADSLVVAGTPSEIISAVQVLRPAEDPRHLINRISDLTENLPQIEATPLAPLLDRLRAAGFALGVATNDAESFARAHLTSVGIIDRFDFIAGYDSGHGPKPGPGMVQAFLAQTGLPPASVAMIGDSTHDLQAGRGAGAHTVGVLTGTATSATLAPLADVILPSIADLPGWLGLT